jgi:hypothetical protein
VPRGRRPRERGARFESEWVRLQYSLQNGMLRPVARSRFETYDPFELGYYGPAARADGRPFYAELWDLDVADLSRVSAFATTWGLLGLFQHNLERVHYVAEWRGNSKLLWDPLRLASPESLPERYVEIDEGPRPPYQRHQFIESGVRPRLSPSHQNVAVVLDRESGESRTEPVEQYFGRYVRGARILPLDSVQLWDFLQEPLEEVSRAVIHFRRVYAACVHAQASYRKVPRCRSEALEAQLTRYMPKYYLDRQLDGVAPLLQPSTEGYQTGWAFPSLLSAAYLMLRQDLTTPGRRLLHCRNPKCNRPVITDRSDREFCSRTCKNTQMSREQREKKRREGEAE